MPRTVKVSIIDSNVYLNVGTERLVLSVEEARKLSARLKKQLNAVSYPRMSTLDADLLLLLKSFGVTTVKQLREHNLESLIYHGVPHVTAVWLLQWVAPRGDDRPVRLTPPRESPRWLA